ncbi:hypothetical protein ALC57_14969 [Trachymyrmex cornetzi]|uniref:Uncharacterized protein n=1 Tax=Trachymyrmex cornetzi TaxID=471704 RepID=A0A195DK97_9HYME|nr:hypothetical protein ALC57_14969 [Trachymyrmex cornetzi]
MFNEAVKSRGGKMAAAVTLQVPFGSCTRKARLTHRNTLLRDISNLIPQIFVFIGCLILCSRSIFCHEYIREDLLCVDERKKRDARAEKVRAEDPRRNVREIVSEQPPTSYCCKERESRSLGSVRLAQLAACCSVAASGACEEHVKLRTPRPPRPPSDAPTRYSVYTIP